MAAEPVTLVLHPARETNRYWVYERPANPDRTMPDTFVTVHWRKGAEKPFQLTVVVTPTTPSVRVQGGRMVDDDDE